MVFNDMTERKNAEEVIAKQAKLGQTVKLKSRRATKAAGRPGRELKKAA